VASEPACTRLPVDERFANHSFCDLLLGVLAGSLNAADHR
jgi:hypothetical protein